MKIVITICVFIFSLYFTDYNYNNPKEQQSSSDIKIIQKRINYNADRKKLSLEYMKERHGLKDLSEPKINPSMIIIHYTGGGTLNSIYNYFNNTELEDQRTINKKESKLNVSAHFLVDRNGDIYQLIDENLFARHTIGLNYCSIGVENIGSNQNPLTKEQLESNIKLVKYLVKRHDIKYLIGHSEYLQFRKSALWKETNPDYITYKIDPGNSFMKELRDNLTEYSLKYKP